MIKAAKRFVWLAVLVGAVGIPITNFTLAKQLATTVWHKGYAIVYPTPLKPGPIAVNLGSDPTTTVIITADDGKDSWYEIHYPILQKYRLPCTQFVIPLRVGDYQFMTWEEIREVKAWGCDVQSHTLSHRDLTSLTKEDAIQELEGSRKALEEKMGYSPTVLASPMGRYNRQILEMMKKAGYEAHVLGFGGEDEEEEKINLASEGLLRPLELVRYDVKNYHTAEDVCKAVKKAAGKPQILIFVYHFGARRTEPVAKAHYKSFASIKVQIAEQLTVFEDVFDEMMSCVAQERDAGRIRLSSIPEALSFHRERERQERLAAAKLLEQYRKEQPAQVVPVPTIKQPARMDEGMERKEVSQKREAERRRIRDITTIMVEERRR